MPDSPAATLVKDAVRQCLHRLDDMALVGTAEAGHLDPIPDKSFSSLQELVVHLDKGIDCQVKEIIVVYSDLSSQVM